MINNQFEYIYALSRMRGIGDVLLSKILLKYGSAKDILEKRFDPISTWEKKVDSIIDQNISENFVDEGLAIAQRLEELGGRPITILDDEYPLGLLQIGKAPPILYILGEIKPEDTVAVAVVGTRKASEKGLKNAYQLAELLSYQNITVISGLALGIDTAAHRGSLKANGRTIAVIGSGLDNIYPPQNTGLWDEILQKGGAIVSQFPPGTSPNRWQFPQRNWTMSGMAQGTIVVEASSTSGAKIQAEFTAKQGRVLFLTTNQVEEFAWARELAEQNKAIIVRSITDIIDVLRPIDTLSELPIELKITKKSKQKKLFA